MTKRIPFLNTRAFGPAPSLIAEMSSASVVDRALMAAELSYDILSGPSVFIPYKAQAIFVEHAARHLGARHLGALLASRYGYRALGRFADHVLDAPHLDEAFARSARALKFILCGPTLELRDAGEYVVLQFNSELSSVRGAHHVNEGVAMIIVDLVRNFNGQLWRPAWVELPSHPNADDTTLEMLFDAPIYYGATWSGVALSKREFTQPNPRPSLAREALTLTDLLVTASIPALRSTADLVNNALYLQAAIGDFSEDAIANRLAMGRHTLQRKLRAEGVMFRELLNEFRLARARAMLIETDHSIVEIAQALGYKEVNSLRRAFKNWTGLSMNAFRGTTKR